MRYVLLFAAILLYAIGNLLFAVPNHIMNGGITGLSQISYYIFKTNIGLSLLLFNLPLFIFAFFKYRHLFFKSVVSMIVFSLAVGLLQDYIIPFGVQNIWIGSIIGGFWMGVSLGILAKLNASLGGGSLLGKMIHLRYGISLSKSIFVIDSSVYPLSLFIIGGTETLFSLILTAFSAFGVYVVGLLSDKIPAKDNKPSFQ
ncbi:MULTISPECIES: YitT family protein [unclassified Paenibacillus]|uniref:YitT family protein n=1 Tax=unclassified Paenibacillus TaxID=185978 RepID=UPI001AE27497|nr:MULTISPECIES: YitT family protein [unclassified Paenibacillus]MBP1155562.1 uncharacterized membrane-anchored protein YitT (DUF2179 family) [Paenibacillus sp. PvP091]MBP1169052.1 uncharacterized membrane-anchored protein YitT (DUF2179 family) [Paenibacillus sp. PvR098]MBP2440080.1 uncharacterized membrane-anchored protein YitT (DUF2179 family) [Paenibacillus sp. PvP052]